MGIFRWYNLISFYRMFCRVNFVNDKWLSQLGSIFPSSCQWSYGHKILRPDHLSEKSKVRTRLLNVLDIRGNIIPYFAWLRVYSHQELLTLLDVDWPFPQWSSLHGQPLLVTESIFSTGIWLFIQRHRSTGLSSRDSDDGSINPQDLRKLFRPSFLFLLLQIHGQAAFPGEESATSFRPSLYRELLCLGQREKPLVLLNHLPEHFVTRLTWSIFASSNCMNSFLSSCDRD